MAHKKVYNVYKGLQKPLIFKGFKGKFIYWGLGTVAGSVVLGALIGALMSPILGGITMIVAIVLGYLITSIQQKKGLHTKTKHKGIFIIAPINRYEKNGL